MLSPVRGALVVLGPNVHNPKLVLWLDFEGDGTGGPPVKLLRMRPAEDGEERGGGELDCEADGEGEEAAARLRISCSPSAYAAPLLPSLRDAVVRKVARALVTDAVSLCGTDGYGPNKVHVLLQVAGQAEEGEGAARGGGWQPRHDFTLRAPRRLQHGSFTGRRAPPAPTPAPGSVVLGAGRVWGGSVYRLAVLRVVRETGAGSGKAFDHHPESAFSWLQWTAPPLGFRAAGLPAAPIWKGPGPEPGFKEGEAAGEVSNASPY
jgi:hypothetical protein